MTYSKRVLIGIDQLFNTFCGGWPDETLSSRAWRWEMDGVRSWPRVVIDALFWWDKHHCQLSYVNERKGEQLPPELRTGWMP